MLVSVSKSGYIHLFGIKIGNLSFVPFSSSGKCIGKLFAGGGIYLQPTQSRRIFLRVFSDDTIWADVCGAVRYNEADNCKLVSSIGDLTFTYFTDRDRGEKYIVSADGKPMRPYWSLPDATYKPDWCLNESLVCHENEIVDKNGTLLGVKGLKVEYMPNGVSVKRIGDVAMQYDATGRVVRVGDTKIEYYPDGRLAQV